VQDYGPELEQRSGDCEGISSRPTSLGGWTKPTSA
jgi:hypothetical protein